VNHLEIDAGEALLAMRLAMAMVMCGGSCSRWFL
jgi:hypothetical protein